VFPAAPESAAAADLARVLRWMVDRADEVEVKALRSGEAVALEARVAPADVGKVLGRSGRTVRALRTLLRARGERDGARYELDVLEP
jgi:predicted RNA-binding protein YlqC (UPF0109 family)